MFKQATLTLGITLAIGTLLLPLGAYAKKAKGPKDSSKVEVAANDGGDNSGGGNTIKNKLVEKYLHDDPSDIKGFKEYQVRLAKIAETLPGLSAAMKEKLADMDVYLVPKQISELPASKTGLHFTTEQPIYQTSSEIFISEPGIATMTPDEVGDTLVHEAVMSLTNVKQSDQVRPVSARLLSEKASTDKIQAALLKFNFGAYFTDAQVSEFVKVNTLTTFFGNLLYEAKPMLACQGTAEDEKLYADLLDKGSKGDWMGPTMELSEQITFEANEKSAGDIWIGCGGGGMFLTGIPANNSPLCREVETSYHDEDKLDQYKIPNLVNRYAALKAGGKQYNRLSNKAMNDFAEAMGRSNAYLSAMALSPANKDIDVKANVKFLERNPERLAVYQKLKAKIAQRRKEIDFGDQAAVYRLRCNSYKALAREIEKMATPGAIEKYGLDKKEGDSNSLDDDQPIAVKKSGSAE